MSGVFSYFLRPHLILPSVVVIVLAVGATWLLRDRLGGRARRVLFLLFALSVGLVVVATLLREPQVSFCPSCLGDWTGLDKILTGTVGTDVALNVVLFVPPVFLATLFWRAPWRTVGIAALVSLVIEVTQSIMGLGANDLMDLLTNTAGALIGAAVASFVLIVRDAVVDRRLDLARTVKVVVSLLLGAAVLVGGPVWAASQRQALGVRLMMGTFAGTTLADYQASRTTTWEPKLIEFWEATGQPTMSSRADQTHARERATWNIYFAVVCVIGEWTPSGFTAVPLSGQACSAPLDLDS